MKRQETFQRQVARAAENDANDALSRMPEGGVEYPARNSACNAVLAKAHRPEDTALGVSLSYRRKR